MITFQLIESLENLKNIEKEWRWLQEQSPHTPFQDFSWHLSWWENVGRALDQNPFMMTAWDNSKLILILPACLSRDGDVLQWSAQEVSDYCDVITTKDNAWIVSKAVSRLRSKFSGTHIRLKQVRTDSLAYGEMSKMRSFSQGVDVNCPTISIGERGHDDWLAIIDRKEIGEANRRKRRLNEVGHVSLREHRDADEICTTIKQVISDKQAWLEQRNQKNILCTRDGEKFLVEALQRMFENGYVHITSLNCDNEQISNQIAFVKDRKYYFYFGAWKYTWKNYAPGKLHMLDLIRYAHENGFEEFDMLRGDEEYKKTFSTDSITLHKFEQEKTNMHVLFRSFVRKCHRIVGQQPRV